jgi:hypothetical protein
MAKPVKDFSVEFDQVQINKLFNELLRNVSAVTLKNIVRGEAAAVLLSAAKKTRIASKKLIIKTSGMEKAARVYKNRNPRWITRSAELLAKRKARLAEKLRRIGSARDAWLAIIRKLNLKPANANQAKGLTKLMGKKRPLVDGKIIYHKETGGREIVRGKGSYALEIKYGNPIGRWTGASPALKSAVLGRRKFFRSNLRAGVFNSAKETAAKYPGIQINKL